ncbi:MFS general substrate transporter [Coprinopsis marcescibilis]|uniref:MFS general substrate transporter n=1 Tax=Coprinopsis marcescibilis TaxID=230819 RepID=A0A5C3KVE0_COPMA|nr:MFS general substrate transporter [Coprinopsis marcescibilis]
MTYDVESLKAGVPSLETEPADQYEERGTEKLEKDSDLATTAKPSDEESNDDDEWKRDPDNPRNWTSLKKWTAVVIVAGYCFITPLSSSMMAPGLEQIRETYNIANPTIVALTLSIYLISFAFGPLILSPLSEMYGRTWILHISNLFTTAFNLGCAFAPDTGTLLALRFIAGFWGSAPVAIGGGSIADVFDEDNRASAMALFSLGPLFGPAIGPAAGGFIAQDLGMKWVFIIIAIVSGVASLIGIPFLKETYAPVIRLQKAKRSANPEAETARVIASLGGPTGTKAQIIWINLSRPIALLFGNFVCFILSSYMALNYGIYFLMFATFPKLFREAYGFRPGVGGLAYLGIGFGFIVATFVGAKFLDGMYRLQVRKNGGMGTPEMRMPVMFIASLIVPVGLLWYGWSAHVKLHWMMPIAGTFIYGFGLMAAYLPIQLYLVDAFTYAASATGAASVFRSLLGFVFPLFGQQLTDALGLGPANTLLAGVAILIGVPFPIWIYFKGAAMRERSNLSR